jgi:hypothetical protein
MMKYLCAALLVAAEVHGAPLPRRNTTRREDFERVVVGGGGINSIWRPVRMCSRRGAQPAVHLG